MSRGADDHRTEAARLRRGAQLTALLVFIVSIAGFGAFAWLLTSKPASFATVAPVVAFALLGAFTMIFAIVRIDKARRHDIAAILADKGMEVEVAPPKARREELFAPFASLKALRHGAKGMRIWARGEHDGVQVFLIEHNYTVHTGKSNHTVRHTAATAACPPQWPSLSLKGQNMITGWWANLRGKDMRLENDAFNERWIVRAENEDFALLFLSPDVQEFLCAAPSGEAWQIGDGWICWYRQKPLKAADAFVPVERLAGLMRLLPPELSHWRA